MKNLVLLCILLLCSVAWAKTPDASDYKITAHVLSTHRDLNQCTLYASINGKSYELLGNCPTSDGYVLLPDTGDFKAKFVDDVHPAGFQSSYQRIELLLPNRKTMKLYVIGTSGKESFGW